MDLISVLKQLPFYGPDVVNSLPVWCQGSVKWSFSSVLGPQGLDEKSDGNMGESHWGLLFWFYGISWDLMGI